MCVYVEVEVWMCRRQKGEIKGRETIQYTSGVQWSDKTSFLVFSVLFFFLFSFFFFGLLGAFLLLATTLARCGDTPIMTKSSTAREY
jgi:hypothetical protein